MIKLIVSDMDGTLLKHNGGISKENIEAILYAKEKGADFAIATGRDYSSISKIMNAHGLSCMSILGNGAQFASKEGEVLSSAYFPKKQFKEVIKVFDDLSIHYMIFTTAGFFSTHDPDTVRDAFIERCCVQFDRDIDEYKEQNKYSYLYPSDKNANHRIGNQIPHQHPEILPIQNPQMTTDPSIGSYFPNH